MRLCRRFRAPVHLLGCGGHALSEAAFWPAARSDRHPCRYVPRVNYDKLSSERQGEPSSAVRERVTAARILQAERFKGTRLLTNADMGRPRCAATASWMARASG